MELIKGPIPRILGGRQEVAEVGNGRELIDNRRIIRDDLGFNLACGQLIDQLAMPPNELLAHETEVAVNSCVSTRLNPNVVRSLLTIGQRSSFRDARGSGGE
jgi:hypothetical protein